MTMRLQRIWRNAMVPRWAEPENQLARPWQLVRWAGLGVERLRCPCGASKRALQCLPGVRAAQELTNETCHFSAMGLQREVAGIEHVNLGVRDVRQ